MKNKRIPFKNLGITSTPWKKTTPQDRPEYGKVYSLTGGAGSKCIANGNTWKESEVKK